MLPAVEHVGSKLTAVRMCFIVCGAAVRLMSSEWVAMFLGWSYMVCGAAVRLMSSEWVAMFLGWSYMVCGAAVRLMSSEWVAVSWVVIHGMLAGSA